MNLHDAFDGPVPVVVLAEDMFGETGGKTANGVVMHSELFEAKAILDSSSAGQTAREVLGKSNAPAVPIVSSLSEALELEPSPAALIVGVAPVGGTLPEAWEVIIRDAMAAGCDIVSGMHVFLGDQPMWRDHANEHGVEIYDVRKPPADEELRVGDGRVDELDANVVLTMGTDCAVGKRTTTFELYRAATEAGLDAGWVATGQTGIMVGANEGVVIDRVPSDFTAGVVEDMVYRVGSDHDLVFVEGQASLTHRAYSGVTLAILHGSWPDAVVLADDPSRRSRTHFEQFEVVGVDTERRLIEDLSDARVAAISTWGNADEAADRYGLPAGNVYDDDGPTRILEGVMQTLSLEASRA